MPIIKIKARQIFDSKGEPTLEVDLTTDAGLFRSSVSSPAQINLSAAQELRDGDQTIYNGRSVFKAVDMVNDVISPQLIQSNLEVDDQTEIDKFLVKLDGTDDKSNLGANAILGVSLACCKAAAAKKGLPLYRYIAELAKNSEFRLPVPCFSMINGGKFAGNALVCQQFMILPIGATSFAEAMKMGTEVYRVLEKKIAESQEIQLPIPVSDEGAFVPLLDEDRDALNLIQDSIKTAGYDGQIKIALDMAASSFYKEGGYDLQFKSEESDPEDYIEAEALNDQYLEYLKDFPSIVSIEDPFDMEDWDGWEMLKNQPIQIVADDLTAMNLERIEEAIERKLANSIALKMSQIGTVMETVNCARMVKLHNWGYIVCAGDGETEDNFIADFAVGLATGQFRAGAPCRGERTSKYNQLLRIEEELGKNAKYVGLDYRNPLSK